MAKTVIDELIVSFGLDPSKFKKGQKKINEAIDETARKAKGAAGEEHSERKSSDKERIASLKKEEAAKERLRKQNRAYNKQVTDGTKMVSRGVTDAALKFASLFGVITSAKGLIGWFTSLSTDLRQAGIEADLFGMKLSRLRAWQYASQVVGGTSAGITGTIVNLHKMLYNAHYMGQVSDQMIALARYGVNVQDASGKMLNYHKIMLNAAAAYKRLRGEGMSKADASIAFSQMGFDVGSIRMIEMGSRAINKYYESRRKLTKGEAARAAANEKFREQITETDQALRHVGRQILIKVAPALTTLFKAIGSGVQYFGKHIGTFESELTNLSKWATSKKGGAQLKGFFENLASVVATLANGLKDIHELFHWGTTPSKNKFLNPVAGGKAANEWVSKHWKWFGEHFGYNNPKATTLGMRSNNPGNLQLNHKELKFASLGQGIWAAWWQLNHDRTAHGDKTLAQLITRWAPPKSNPTAKYIAAISQWSGIGANQPITTHAQMLKILQGIFSFENRKGAVSQAQINRALLNRGALARIGPTPAAQGAHLVNSSVKHTTANVVHIHSLQISGVKDAHEVPNLLMQGVNRRLSATQMDSAFYA